MGAQAHCARWWCPDRSCTTSIGTPQAFAPAAHHLLSIYPPPMQEQGDGTLTLAPGVRIPRAVVDISFSRSSGPGGQNVNKLSTRCQLRLKLADLPIDPEARLRLEALAGHLLVGDGELLIDSESGRSQSGNREECLAKLRMLLLKAIPRPKPRRKTKPSKGSVERRLRQKKTRAGIKRLRGGSE